VKAPPSCSDLKEISRIQCPPDAVITAILDAFTKDSWTTEKVRSVSCQHIMPTPKTTYLLWIIVYWAELRILRPIQKIWSEALEVMDNSISDVVLTLPIQNALDNIQWLEKLQGCPDRGNAETHILSRYLTNQWLLDKHLNQMLELLRDELISKGVDTIKVQSTHFYPKIYKGFLTQDKYVSDRMFYWCQEDRHGLETGIHDLLGFTVHINDNHFLAMVLDFQKAIIWSGDSLTNKINPGVMKILEWWTHFHTGHWFKQQSLPVTRQLDSYSCGLLTCNALSSFLLNSSQLLVKAEAATHAWLRVFLQVVEHHLKTLVSNVYT